MRMVVTDGTGRGLAQFPVAAKSGTAQVGISKGNVNSWVEGFFPYDNPRYSFVVLMESGKTNQVSATSAMRFAFQWMELYAPEYLQ